MKEKFYSRFLLKGYISGKIPLRKRTLKSRQMCDDTNIDISSKVQIYGTFNLSLINTPIYRLSVHSGYLFIHIVSVLNSADPLIISMMTGFVIRKGLSHAGTRYTSSGDSLQMPGYRKRAVDPAICIYRISVCQKDINCL